MKKPDENHEIIAEAIFNLSNEIRFLGNGNADRSKGLGAIEGLAMLLSDSNEEIGSSIGGISSTLETVAESISEVASAIVTLAESQSCKCKTEKKAA